MTSVTKGRNVSIYEKPLERNEYNKLSELIHEILKDCINSQIFIENSIVGMLQRNGLLYRVNYAKNFHYGYSDDMFNGEQPFDFAGNNGTIFLVANCKGYMQVSYFRRKDISYVHYMHGIQQIVFIYENKPIVTQASTVL